MAMIDYNERVAFQQMLDELFPRGAYISLVLDDEGNGRFIPEGLEMTVGRVFCSAAELVDEEWVHTILLDPSYESESPQPVREIDVWSIREAEDVDDLYEGETYSPELELLEVLRLHARPGGPRRVYPGARDLVTALHEAELFPNGIETQEGVPDAGDTG